MSHMWTSSGPMRPVLWLWGLRCLLALFFRPGEASAGSLAPKNWFQVCGDCWPSARTMLGGPARCDDGNSQDGDGCSSNCEVEDGWTCTREVVPIMNAALNIQTIIEVDRRRTTHGPLNTFITKHCKARLTQRLLFSGVGNVQIPLWVGLTYKATPVRTVQIFFKIRQMCWTMCKMPKFAPTC